MFKKKKKRLGGGPKKEAGGDAKHVFFVNGLSTLRSGGNGFFHDRVKGGGGLPRGRMGRAMYHLTTSKKAQQKNNAPCCE